MLENQLHNLKVNIFEQAKLYLEEIGEFAPFGSTIFNEVITPVGYYVGAESFDSKNAVEILQMKFSEKIKQNVIDAAAIGFDVIASFKNDDGLSERRDAMCLKISVDGENWSEEYFPYIIIDGECVWR